MRNLKNYGAVMRSVKKEPVVIDLEDIMDSEQIDASAESGQSTSSYMKHLLCGNKIDHGYMQLLYSFREDGSENPLRSIRYEVDNGGYDKRQFKPLAHKERRREDRNTVRVPHVEASKKKKTTKQVDSVDAMLIGNKENSQGPMVLDENYKSYLTWLVQNSKSSIQVKCEEDHTMSNLSDSDMIVAEDHPFMDEEDSPFVPSKDSKVIDLEEEKGGDQRNSWFKKEIINILKQPYNEEEFKELYNEASLCRKLTKCWELRDGRDICYNTKQTRPSYLDMYPEFKRKLHESLSEKDCYKALNLLRGFIFYLEKVARDDAFEPWSNHECLKITCS